MEHLQMDDSPTKEEVLEDLVDLYAQTLKRLAYTYVKDWSTAEDIIQEVFITCYNKMDDFREESSFKTWLYKITVNKCKDLMRSRWFRYGRPIDFVIDKIKGHGLTMDETLTMKEDEVEVSLKVLSLPAKYREVIILFYFAELKIREIEELTNLKPETIKTRLRRAKIMLQKELEGFSYDEFKR